MTEGGADERVMRRALAALLAATALLKLVYVFALTDYRHYLFSDFLGYWFRAEQRLAGHDFDDTQWAVWPPLPHILLSGYLQLVDLAGLAARRLEAVLAANVLMSTASVALVYGIARQTLQSARWALGVAALYAAAFPLVYFNAFVMSEHPATLCMLAALWLALRSPRNAWALAGAGALLGLATGLRPVLGPFGAAFFVYVAAAERFGRKGLLHAVVFSLGFAAVVGAAALETSRISRGQVTGLGANGAISFFFSHCRARQLITQYRGESYDFTLPALADRPENGTVWVNRPIHDQGYFFSLGLECLREQPDPVAGALERFRNLFFGPLLPSVPSAWGFTALLPPFRWFMLACALALPLALFLRRASGVRLDAAALLGGILALAAASLYLFSAEHRYLYPLAGPAYVLCAAILMAAVREPRRMARPVFAWIAILAALALAPAWLRRSNPPVAAAISRLSATAAPTTVAPQTLLATLRLEGLRRDAGEPLWQARRDEAEPFAVFRTCMDVREPGTYEFLVVSPRTFSLGVDGAALLSQRDPDPNAAFGVRKALAAGKHAYALRVDGAVRPRATWRRIGSPRDAIHPAFGMHYIGEAGDAAVFLAPQGC